MNKQLEEIKEALSKATPGPWKWETLQYQLVSDSGPVISAEIHYTDTPMLGWKESDANLISNAPQWIASLVAEVERLNYIIAVMEADSNNVYASCGKFHGENKEMQKTLAMYGDALTRIYEYQPQKYTDDVEGLKEIAEITLQSLKGDKS